MMQKEFYILIPVFISFPGCLKKKTSQLSQKNTQQNEVKEKDISLRVVGGTYASEREVPFIVSIQGRSQRGGWYHQCGGSLINQQTVLTAGHCLADSAEKLTRPDEIRVVYGSDDLSSSGVPYSTVSEIVIHPGYIKSLQKAEKSELISLAANSSGLDAPYFAPMYGFDLGLVFLAKKIDFASGRSTSILPDLKSDSLLSKEKVNILKGSVFQLAGWGITERRTIDQLLSDPSQFDHQKTSDRLKTGLLPVISTESCHDKLLSWFRKKLGFAYGFLAEDVKGTISQTMAHTVCAGEMNAGSVSFCSGDSGGPLYLKVPESGPRIRGAIFPDARSRFIQTGIVSFTLGCNTEGIPDIYTRVSDFSDWITSTTSSRSSR